MFRRALTCLLAVPLLAMSAPALAAGGSPPSAPGELLGRTATDGVFLTYRQAPGTFPMSYDIFRGTSADNLSLLGSTTASSYGVPLSASTAAGTSYVFAVRAVDLDGAGPLSAPITVSTPPAPVVPSATKAAVIDSVASTNAFTIESASASNAGFAAYGPMFTMPPGEVLQPGTYAIDPTHGTLQGVSCSPAPVGSMVVSQVMLDSTGALRILDADASYSCGTSPRKLSLRYGTDRPFAQVDAPDVAAGRVPVGTATPVVATYRNAGTTSITVDSMAINGQGWSIGSDNTCATVTLAPGSSCHAALSIKPVQGVPLNAGTLTFTDSTPMGTHTRALSATGIVPPLSIQPNGARRASGKVTLNWTNDPEASQRATSYRILRGPDAAHLTLLDTVLDSKSLSTEYTDPDTADGTRTYAVQGVNEAGSGPVGTPQVLDLALRAPTGLAGSSAINKVSLTWAAPSALPANPITGYAIYRGTTAAALTEVATSSARSWTGPAPAAGQHAFFAVAALTADGPSPRSAVVDVVATTMHLMVGQGDASTGLRIAALPLAGGPGVPFLSDDAFHFDVNAHPNGTWLAYTKSAVTSTGPGQRDIWMRRTADGSNLAAVSANTAYDEYSPSWSPDGRQVAYARAEGDTVTICRTAVTAAGGGACIPVTQQDVYDEPSWLDATTLVASDYSSAHAPLVKLTTAGRATPIPGTADGYTPVVSPDGTQVAFLVPGASDFTDVLKVVNLTNGAVRALPAPGGVFFTAPSWTRDMSAIYVVGVSQSASHVYRIGTLTGGTTTTVPGTVGDQFAVAVDTPDTTAPVNVKLAGVPAVTLATTVTPSFTASDALNKIASYSLSYRRAAYNGGYSAPTVKVLTRAAAIAVARGYSYCFSVRATDRAGNTSAATPEQCVMVPLDDRSLARSSGFAPVTSSAYFAGTAMKATGRGQTLTRTGMTALRQLTVIASACPTCGVLDVFVGGARVGTVNTASRTTVNRKVFTLPAFSVRNGTVTLKVASTGKTVVVDGLGFRK